MLAAAGEVLLDTTPPPLLRAMLLAESNDPCMTPAVSPMSAFDAEEEALPPLPTRCAAAPVPAFEAAASFEGRRAGATFKLAESGLGYYRDASQPAAADAAPAPLAASGGGSPPGGWVWLDDAWHMLGPVPPQPDEFLVEGRPFSPAGAPQPTAAPQPATGGVDPPANNTTPATERPLHALLDVLDMGRRGVRALVEVCETPVGLPPAGFGPLHLVTLTLSLTLTLTQTLALALILTLTTDPNQACALGRRADALALVSAGFTMLSPTLFASVSALHVAAINGHSELLSTILDTILMTPGSELANLGASDSLSAALLEVTGAIGPPEAAEQLLGMVRLTLTLTPTLTLTLTLTLPLTPNLPLTLPLTLP